MAPQDDLTAERAATDMYNRLFSVMRSPEHEHHAKARLKLFYQVTRQAALQARVNEAKERVTQEDVDTIAQLREQNRVLKKALAEIAMGNEVWERDQMIDCAEAALTATSQEGRSCKVGLNKESENA